MIVRKVATRLVEMLKIPPPHCAVLPTSTSSAQALFRGRAGTLIQGLLGVSAPLLQRRGVPIYRDGVVNSQIPRWAGGKIADYH